MAIHSFNKIRRARFCQLLLIVLFTRDNHGVAFFRQIFGRFGSHTIHRMCGLGGTKTLSGQALCIMTVAGKLSNADAIFVGVEDLLLLAFPSEQLRRRPSACGRKMGDLFNTLNKPLPRRSSKTYEEQLLCCYCVCSYLYLQLRWLRTFHRRSRAMYASSYARYKPALSYIMSSKLRNSCDFH